MEEMYSIQELMVLLKVSDETLYRWIKAGKLRAVKVGGQWRVWQQALDEFLNS